MWLFKTLSFLPATLGYLSTLGEPALTPNTSIPATRGQGKWGPAIVKAKALLANITIEQKVALVSGVGWSAGHCVGNINAQSGEGLEFSGLCLEDSPLGVRFADRVSAFPAGINVAATFDRRLMRLRGEAMGKEFRGKGVHVALGPMMNMGRVPEGGRNWEGFGADPYLSGEASYETIKGIQSQGVQACAKHYLNNEQEQERRTASSNVDDRTQHEVYLHPFLRSVQADVASVMCSYNRVNGTWACENPALLNGYLKHELGFQGYVMSDWDATHSTMSAEAGLDMTMPSAAYFGVDLVDSVRNGTISEARLDDMATRVVSAWYLLGQDKGFPAVNFDAFRPDDPVQEHVDVQADHHKLIREIGAASIVLLKNNNGTLPLVKPRSIVLVGSDAGPARLGPNSYPDRAGDDGTLVMGWGSGTTEFPYLISPLEAVQAQAREDHTSTTWWLDDLDTKGAANIAAGRSAVLVFINSNSGEQYLTVDGNEGDRKNLTAWHAGDDLVKSVASANKNTIVIVHSVGPLILEEWVEHPNVTAVVWAGLPGQESGNSLADILYGRRNPSGRLPYTIAKRVEDYPAPIVTGTDPNQATPIPYNEGLNIDYRHFDSNGIASRYEFGYGLSYTNFRYSDLEVTTKQTARSDVIDAWANGRVIRHGVGASLDPWLHDPYLEISFQLRNTGSRHGSEVPQLYLTLPKSANSPPFILKGFERVPLAASASKRVSFILSKYDLSVWSAVEQGWVKPIGRVELVVGASSRDHRLHGHIL